MVVALTLMVFYLTWRVWMLGERIIDLQQHVLTGAKTMNNLSEVVLLNTKHIDGILNDQ